MKDSRVSVCLQYEAPLPEMKDSQLLTNPSDINWLLSIIPNISGTSKVNQLYRASRDGWKPDDYIAKVNGRTHTITLIKSKAGKVAGAYISIKMKGNNSSVYDENALLFSIDNKLKFSPVLGQKALTFPSNSHGPYFGNNSLTLQNHEVMNAESNGRCRTNGQGFDYFNIPNDSEGNSILTGEGNGQEDDGKTYTCVEIEAYQIIF